MKEEKNKKIETSDEYVEVMKQIDVLLYKATLNGGFSSLSKLEHIELDLLSKRIEEWENENPSFIIKPDKTVIELLELHMYVKRMKQKELAKFLDYPASRLSEFLNGKRKLSIELAKKLYSKLNIEPKLLLT